MVVLPHHFSDLIGGKYLNADRALVKIKMLLSSLEDGLMMSEKFNWLRAF